MVGDEHLSDIQDPSEETNKGGAEAPGQPRSTGAEPSIAVPESLALNSDKTEPDVDELSDTDKDSLHECLKVWADEKTKQGFEFDKNLLTVIGFTNGAAFLTLRGLVDSQSSWLLFFIACSLVVAVGSILYNQYVSARHREHTIKRTHQVLKGEITPKDYYENPDVVGDRMLKWMRARNLIALGFTLVVVLLFMVVLATSAPSSARLTNGGTTLTTENDDASNNSGVDNNKTTRTGENKIGRRKEGAEGASSAPPRRDKPSDNSGGKKK